MPAGVFGPDSDRLLTEPELLSLPSIWMTSACMNSGFRRLTGWLGFAPAISSTRSFTCRVKTRAGIYGFMPVSAQPGERAIADFRVYYFPTEDDPVLEKVSIEAALAATSPQAKELVRNFPVHPDFAALFHIGDMRLALTHPEKNFGLSITALTRKRTIAAAGIAAPDGIWVVPPGGIEEDLPALDLARDLFRVLSAGFACIAEKAPDGPFSVSAVGAMRTRDSNGKVETTATSDASLRTEILMWGDAAYAWPMPREKGDASPYRVVRVAAGAEKPDEKESQALVRPRLVVLNGFLGSGKTSFLNQFIEFHLSHDQLVAVIQNEIGETGVDANLLEGEESVLALDAGCVCCTLAGGLTRGLRQLTETLSPEIIALETTGLANPMNMVDELREISDLAELAAIVAVVDAARFQETLAASEIAAEQIRAADIVVLNKCDLVDEATRRDIEKEIRCRNPHAQIVLAEHGRVHPSLFVNLMSRHVGKEERPEETCCCCGHHHNHAHEGHHEHHHGLTHMDEGFAALRFKLAPEVDREEIMALLQKSPAGVMRIKGIARVKGEEGAQIIQYVPGQADCEPAARETKEAPFLLIIGRDLDAAALRNLWRPLLEEKDK